MPPIGFARAFVDEEKLARQLLHPTTSMLDTISRHRLTTITSSGWRYFYRNFLPTMAQQSGTFKEDLAIFGTMPLSPATIRFRAEQRTLDDCAVWVRRIETYGVQQIMFRVALTDVVTGWLRERCPQEIRNCLPGMSQYQLAEVALAMRGLAMVGKINAIKVFKPWGKAAIPVLNTLADTLQKDMDQYWWDSTASSDEDVERFGNSWGRKSNEQLKQDHLDGINQFTPLGFTEWEESSSS